MTHGRAVVTMVLVTLMWSIAGVVTRHLEAAPDNVARRLRLRPKRRQTLARTSSMNQRVGVEATLLKAC